MKISASQLGASVALLILIGAGATACAAPATDEGAKPQASTSSSSAPEESTTPVPVEEAPEPITLDGAWKQNNANAPETSWQEATISGNTIEVYWVTDGGNSKALYWAGTVEIPEGVESFAFESVNDTTKTEAALLASDAATKTFTFENDELSYEVTALGETMTVRLSRG